MNRANQRARRPRAARQQARATAGAAVSLFSANRVLVAGLVVYLAVLAGMVAFDSYTFILKGAVLPFLLAVALLSGRFGAFVNDWAVFLGAVVLFDALRSLAFAVTTHFELPMYASYAIDWERWLSGGRVAPLALQELRAGLASSLWLDRLCVLLHASHFLFFLLFGFVLWLLRREAFRTYAAAMAALLYIAVLVQFLVPTIPPWMAADDFMLLPPIVRIFRSIYNVHLPALVAVFDVNPIAAMPSLHAAMPILCAFLAVHFLGWAGLPVCAYAAGVAVAVVYLGEHYLVDVLAGALLALAVYAGARCFGAPARSSAAARKTPAERLAPRPIVASLILIASALALGRVAGGWLAPLPVTRAFVERELVGRSPGAHYLLGRIAFADGDFARAQAELTRALEDLPGREHQKTIRSFLGRSAHGAGDVPAAIAALEPLRATSDDVGTLVTLGVAYAENEQYEKGIAVLRESADRFPAEPEPLYWLARVRYARGEIDRAGVGREIDALRRFPEEKSALLVRSLSALLDGAQLSRSARR